MVMASKKIVEEQGKLEIKSGMNIFFVIDSLGKGGVERRMLELIKHMTRSTNYNVTLVCLDDYIEYPEVHKLPINFVTLKRASKKDLTIFTKLYKLVKVNKPVVIHSWSSMSNIYIMPVAKLLGIRFVTSAIADSPNNLTLRNQPYLRAKIVFPFADRITSNSLAGLYAYGAPMRKSRCIYNGFDDKRIISLEDPHTLKQQIGIKNEMVIGMVAGFEERKDYATLIEAAKKVIAEDNNCVFLLLGGGPLKEAMMKQVPPGLQEKIRFLGKINNVESYINIFDIAVLCTNSTVHQEGISNAILEYMALSKPVIATAGGGTDEIVVDNKTGFLIPSHDAEILVEKIKILAEQPGLRRQFGEAGRERISSSFTIDKMCSQFYALYEELV